MAHDPGDLVWNGAGRAGLYLCASVTGPGAGGHLGDGLSTGIECLL